MERVPAIEDIKQLLRNLGIVLVAFTAGVLLAGVLAERPAEPRSLQRQVARLELELRQCVEKRQSEGMPVKTEAALPPYAADPSELSCSLPHQH